MIIDVISLKTEFGDLIQTKVGSRYKMGIGFHISLPKTRLKFDSGNVTSAGWQVTLCDPMWHVSSRSGVTTL